MFYHHSRMESFRQPVGAVECACPVTIRMQTDLSVERVDLTYVVGDCLRNIPMARHEMDAQHALWEATLTMPEKAGLVFYRFAMYRLNAVRYYCAPQDHLGGAGRITDQPADCWQITVHERQSVPEWMRNGICYQIFPDRFFRGDREATESRMHEGSLLHTNWADDPVYIRDDRGAVTHWDFFGGDLEGVRQKLDYLQSLNVTILYLNPIFLSFSNHRYDAADYRQVDPLLGGEEALRRLCEEAKNRGIRVLLDGVFSHTGSDSLYFNREGRFEGLGAYQSKESPYYDWYCFKDYPNSYDCWWGVDSMPNVWELTPGYLAYQLWDEDSTVRRWMRCGIAGWRLDVADELPDEFLVQLRRVVLEENPDAILLGEVWEDASNKISYDKRREYLMGRELDSVTNYPFRDSVLDFLMGRIDARMLARKLESQQENYPADIFYSLMNMTGTHDTARLTSLLGGIPAHANGTEAQKRVMRLSDEQKAISRKRVKLYALMQFTHPGMPTVYYGDETLMEGLEDPWNRRTYPWGREDEEMISYFRNLTELRTGHAALRTGTWKTLDMGAVYGAKREKDGEVIVTLIHAGQEAQTVRLEADDRWQDLLTGEILESADGALNLTMEACSARCLKKV